MLVGVRGVAAVGVVVLALVAGGCRSDPSTVQATSASTIRSTMPFDPEAAKANAKAAATPVPEALLSTDQSGCRGAGGDRPAMQLTWIGGPEVQSAEGCIVRLAGDQLSFGLSWDRTGHWLALDGPTTDTWVVDANGARRIGQLWSWSWLGTTGDLLASAEQGLAVHHADGTTTPVPHTAEIGKMRPLSVESDDRHVVGVATIGADEGLYRVDLTDGSATLLRKATEPYSLSGAQVMAGDDVVFSEVIGNDAFFRRLHHDSGKVDTLTRSSKFSGAWGVGSRFDPTAVAWSTDGGCGGPPHVEATLAGRKLRLAGTPVAEMTPKGWLPDGTLLLSVVGGCDAGPVPLWSFKDGVATKLSDGATGVALRTSA